MMTRQENFWKVQWFGVIFLISISSFWYTDKSFHRMRSYEQALHIRPYKKQLDYHHFPDKP